MILVRHVMAETPKTLSPERRVADAAGLKEQYDVGVIPRRATTAPWRASSPTAIS